MALGDSVIAGLRQWSAQVQGRIPSLGEAIVQRIRQRTQTENTDRYGRGFAPYSKDYAKRKASPQVNLTKTGHMLANLGVLRGGGLGFDPSGRGSQFIDNNRYAKRSEISIGFTDPRAAQIAAYHAGGGARRKMPLRDFMGVEELWLNENVDRVIGTTNMPLVNEVFEVRVI